MGSRKQFETVKSEAEKTIGRALNESEVAAVTRHLNGEQPGPVAWANPASQAARDYAQVCAIAHAAYADSRGWPLARPWDAALVNPRTGDAIECQTLSLACVVRYVSGDAEFGYRAQVSSDGGANWYQYESPVAPELDR